MCITSLLDCNFAMPFASSVGGHAFMNNNSERGKNAFTQGESNRTRQKHFCPLFTNVHTRECLQQMMHSGNGNANCLSSLLKGISPPQGEGSRGGREGFLGATAGPMRLACAHPCVRQEVSGTGGAEEGLGSRTARRSWAVRRSCLEVDSATPAARRRASEVDSVVVELDLTTER
jgi:hypothetical protein